MKRTALLSGVVASLLAVGCAPNDVCFRLSDCATGSVCSAGTCVLASPGEAGTAASDPDAAASASSIDAQPGDDDASADGDASDDASVDASPDVVDAAGPG
jgi:hypothetical protein